MICHILFSVFIYYFYYLTCLSSPLTWEDWPFKKKRRKKFPHYSHTYNILFSYNDPSSCFILCPTPLFRVRSKGHILYTSCLLLVFVVTIALSIWQIAFCEIGLLWEMRAMNSCRAGLRQTITDAPSVSNPAFYGLHPFTSLGPHPWLSR